MGPVEIRRGERQLCEGVPRTEVAQGDAGYPSRLMDLDDPPERLYVLGDPEALLVPAVTVVGARKSTPYGEAVAAMAGAYAAEGRVALVTGASVGCDAEAARAAIESRGRVVLVSGCGPDVVWPPQVDDVFEGAARHGGAVVSAEPWGTEPRRYAFPRRNRLIAALAGTMLVAEAGIRTGTMSIAERACTMGREVWAVPGSVFSPASAGTNALVADGEAQALLGEGQVEELMWRVGAPALTIAPPQVHVPAYGDPVMAALAAGPMRADDLAGRLAEGATDVLARLADLERRGEVTRLPDGTYSLSKDAYLAPGAAAVIGQAGRAAREIGRAHV